MTGVLDDYLVDPDLSLLDKTRVQAQVLVLCCAPCVSHWTRTGPTQS